MQPAGLSTREKDEQTMAAEQMALSGERKICQNQVFHRLGFFSLGISMWVQSRNSDRSAAANESSKEEIFLYIRDFMNSF